MRTLTSSTIAAADSESSKPYCLLQISWPAAGGSTAPILIAPGEPTVSETGATTSGGPTLPPAAPVGVKWYAQEDFGSGDGASWDNAQGRVLEWGVVRLGIKADKAVNVVGDCTVKLRDEDKVLFNYFQSIEPQRAWVAIYQQFRGNAESDLVKLHVGIINAPCTWSERDHAVLLDITDISTYFNRTVGNFADRLDCPNVVQTDENKLIPLVFGHVMRARAVAVDFGPVTELARVCNYFDMGLYVNDAEYFPQLTPMEIWIGGERINGQFNGNFFSITERGAPLYTGTVTALGVDCQHLVDSALTGPDGTYVGYYILFTSPDGTVQRKIIQSYDSATHTIVFGMLSGFAYVNPLDPTQTTWIGDAFTNAGHTYTLPIGATYQIGSNVAGHPCGSKVYVARSNYTYVVNDAPSKKVYSVEGYGHPLSLWINGQIWTTPTEWYFALDPSLYTINYNDTATCPGRAVTSITFSLPPSQLDIRMKNDDLWITLDGVESVGDGTGTLLQNPSDIIQAIHTRWMGMTSDNIDADSFAAAKTATAALLMGFALTEQKKGLELCADLAFQARCAEVFFAGQAQLIYLTNVMVPTGTPPTSGADRYLGSLDIARREWNQIVTEITGSYIDNAVRRTIILRSPAAEEFVGGRIAKTIDFWAYASLAPVQGVANFWLNRWQYIWQQIALVDSLRRLDAEPYDLFDLDLAGWFGAGQVARVVGIEHTLGGGSNRAVPGIKLSAEIPYFPSGVCDTLAEAMPPGGCWACETSCQIGCELFCTTQFELNGIVLRGSTEPGSEPGTTPGETTPNDTTPLETTAEGTPPATTPSGTPAPTSPYTGAPTSPPTSAPTEEHTSGPTEAHTSEPTEAHTSGATSEPTAGHTSAPTAAHTAAHTSAPTSPPTSPVGCDACSGATPASIRLTGSDGSSGTLILTEGHCTFAAQLSNGLTAGVIFDLWEVRLGITPIGGAGWEGNYAPATTDGKYDCMSTFVIEVHGITYTLTPS
ncbi:MAG: hypothetical protein ABSA67_14245 [Candidatus Brocadiia bacterium]|jgi:hypothetical protein